MLHLHLFHRKKTGFLFLLFVLPFFAFSQGNSDKDKSCKKSLEFTEEIITFYEVSEDDFDKLNLLDKAKIKTTTESRTIRYCLSNDLIKEVINHDIDDLYPEDAGMLPAQAIFDSDKMSFFNSKGEKLKEEKRSEKSRQKNKEKQKDFDDNGIFVGDYFSLDDAKMIAQFEKKGFDKATLENGVIKSAYNKDKNKIKVYDKDAKLIKLIKKGLSGEVLNVLQTKYAEFDDGSYLPALTTFEKNLKTDGDRVFFKEKSIVIYKDFSRNGKPIKTKREKKKVDEVVVAKIIPNTQSELKLSISPNPTPDQILITADGRGFTENSEILLTDVAGKTLIKRKVFGDQQRVTLNLDTYPQGIYFVKVQNNGVHLFSEKVVKK